MIWKATIEHDACLAVQPHAHGEFKTYPDAFDWARAVALEARGSAKTTIVITEECGHSEMLSLRGALRNARDGLRGYGIGQIGSAAHRVRETIDRELLKLNGCPKCGEAA